MTFEGTWPPAADATTRTVHPGASMTVKEIESRVNGGCYF
jgi:hypothetical protein